MTAWESFALFASFAVAIVLEAAPFLLLGALLSACIERFVPAERLQKLTPRSMPLQLAFGAVAGLALPTCECGVVPVTRRLMAKGAPPAMAVTYMLAAPVVNPVVLASTYTAFRGDLEVVILRVALVLAPALVLGSLAGQIPTSRLLRPSAQGHGADEACGCGCGHEHHEHGGRAHGLLGILRHTASEFVGMGAFLILGAMAAAAFKTFVPPQALALLTDNVLLAVGVMTGLAILLSVCSEADAFVAASFMNMPQSAQLAFMSVGPMVDLKLIAMFLAVFHRRFALALIVTPVLMVYLACVSMALGTGGGGF